jgi:hypothetical protein
MSEGKAVPEKSFLGKDSILNEILECGCGGEIILMSPRSGIFLPQLRCCKCQQRYEMNFEGSEIKKIGEIRGIPIEPIKKHRLMQFFAYGHLPEDLKKVSVQFYELARAMDEMLPNNPEKTVALRKLMEAKDCAVRAVIYRNPE